MTIRLRDEAVLLEPATKADPYTDEQLPDWTQDPASTTPTRIKVEPYSLTSTGSTEQTLTSSAVISRWTAWLPPEFDRIVTPQWRIRWDGDDYDVDGEVQRWKTGRGVRYLVVVLKHVEG